MITHLRHARLLVLAALLLVPAPAHADGLISWLDKLSGPGPWLGANIDVCLKAFRTGDPGGGRSFGIVVSCPESRLQKPHWSWYLGGGAGLAWGNNLDYTGQDVVGKSERVTYVRLGSSLMYTARPWADVGFGAGAMIFQGPRFSSFAVPYVQPVKLAVRPLLFRGTSDLSVNQIEARGWLMVTANWMVLLDRIDGARFGAPADPLREDKESLMQIGMAIDVFRLLRAYDRERRGIR